MLKKIGCQPETNEEGHIVFKYQGDDFYIAVEDEARFIMIWNPWWASISIENPALPYLKENSKFGECGIVGHYYLYSR